jgi:hypothetical protein
VKSEPVIVHAVIGAVVTAIVGILVGKGLIGDPSPETKETIITAVGSVVMVIVGWLARRKVSPVV